MKRRKRNKSGKGTSFPDSKTLAGMRKRLSSSRVLGSAVLSKNATQLDRAKFRACEMIIRFRHKAGISQKELAARLGVDESRVSEILHYKVEGFTLDRLIGYAQVLYPTLKLDLNAA